MSNTEINNKCLLSNNIKRHFFNISNAPCQILNYIANVYCQISVKHHFQNIKCTMSNSKLK